MYIHTITKSSVKDWRLGKMADTYNSEERLWWQLLSGDGGRAGWSPYLWLRISKKAFSICNFKIWLLCCYLQFLISAPKQLPAEMSWKIPSHHCILWACSSAGDKGMQSITSLWTQGSSTSSETHESQKQKRVQNMEKHHLDISGIFLLSHSAVASEANMNNFSSFPTTFSFWGIKIKHCSWIY